jgi:hypothetical protein
MLLSTSRRLLRPALRPVTATRKLSSPTAWNTNYKYPELVPPKTINDEMALGIQDAVDLFIRHGIGRQRLQSLAAAKMPTVQKWQLMMECYMATQVHVLAGLGYPTDESGLSAYHAHLGEFMQAAATPDTQEMWKENGRDTWRLVLTTAFGMDPDDFEEKDIGTFICNNVLHISLHFLVALPRICIVSRCAPPVEARNITHKLATKMQNEDILKKVAERCASLPPISDTSFDDMGGDKALQRQQLEMAQRHHVVQEVLVNEVYLGGNPSMVEECGFGKGERGYVRMQVVMAEHQSDPMVAQYVGSGEYRKLCAYSDGYSLQLSSTYLALISVFPTGMMRILKSAGIDMGSAQNIA